MTTSEKCQVHPEPPCSDCCGCNSTPPSPSELKPCPFCGGKAFELHDDDEFYYVRCFGCNASTDIYSQHIKNPEDPKEAWNRRTL